MVKENCGVVGIFSLDKINVIPMLIDSLRALQHRGQEAWGIAVPNKTPLKKLGLVSSSASEFKKISEEYSSFAAIGHVRYSTIGKSNLHNAQPLKVKDLCIAHNGTISNVEELSNMVGGCSFTPQHASDTLVVAQRLVSLISKLERDVIPGELIKLSKNGVETEMFSTDTSRAHCSFEFTYFAHPSSKMEGSNIYTARKNIGRFLAKKFPFKDADLVIPVPDSARPAALGYAQELGIPFDEGLLKDRYSKKGPLRSFIEPHQTDRIEINRWIIPIQDIIEDKHVIVVDDSLVRGTSSRAIINALRKGGARKISLVITYPPIKFPCFAGIDFPSQEELATYTDQKNYTDEQIIEKVRNDIGADFLGYNDPENLALAIGIPLDSMCFTCVTGNYSSLGIKPTFNTQVQMVDRK